ncbi:MAG: class 1b ribonucleoside-diphosphate reductase subunit alpha [Brevinema sp.]
MLNKPWIHLNNEIMSKTVDGKFQFEKDHEALDAYLQDYVDVHRKKFSSLKERFEYMIQNKYYIDFFKMYTIDDIEAVYLAINNIQFRFASYMSAFKFFESYALKDFHLNIILESYEDRIAAVALFLGQGNTKKAISFAQRIIKQEYQPATPTFMNAGRYNAGELVSCFLDEMGDSLSGISHIIDSSMKLSSIGGGISINLSKVRARGESIKGVDNRSSGILPIMKILEDVFSYANQLGQRPGAGAVYLNIFHQDIYEFIECKKINVDEKVRIKSLSIGVIIPDKFMELVEKNEPFYVFGPHSIYQEYGQYLDDMDMDLMYDQLVANTNIKKILLDARLLFIDIAKTQKESGYPYLFFKGNANKNHALKEIGTINFSNLCTEIMQLSELSEINHYYEEDKIKRGISCNLGSLNIATVMENKSIQQTVYDAMDMLTQVSDLTNISIAPSIKKANEELHSVGLGAMNLHGFFVKNLIAFESEEALEFCDLFFMMVNFYSLQRSMEIAKEKEKTFQDFEKSEYANGNYFDQYLSQELSIKTDKMKELFEGLSIPTVADWKNLKESVQKYGLYHAYRLAIAPNQSTAYIMNATPSVMPMTDMIEVREDGNSTVFYPMPYLTNKNIWLYQSAYNMKQEKILKLISVIQKHIDQGISTILFTNSNQSTKDLAKLYIYAYKYGLKSLYYTRTKKLTIEECLSCSV